MPAAGVRFWNGSCLSEGVRIEDRNHHACAPLHCADRPGPAVRDADRRRASVGGREDPIRRDAFLPQDSRIEQSRCPSWFAAPPTRRLTYAVDPVGWIPDLQPEVETEHLVHRLILTRQVTNLGTLVDVLM